MKCFYCGKEFQLNGKQGGQNRKFCYDCVPDGLNRQEGKLIRRKLYYNLADKQKKELGCAICGYNKYGAVLEWHHNNPHEKDFNPGEIMSQPSIKNWNLYQEEIKKCTLLCANCHREWYIEHKNEDVV